MTAGRFAAIQAVLGLLLFASLDIVVNSACADELADLRANQLLLQRRLDQLAQIPGAGGLYLNFPDPAGAAASRWAPHGGGSFPRSFLIPGTDTSVRVSGQLSEYVLYFFNGANPHLV